MRVEQAEKPYHTEGGIVYSCQYHVIFTPKYRRKVLTGGIGPRLEELVIEKQEEYGYRVLDMEVMADHVHLLLDVDPGVGVNRVVQKIKSYTSHELRSEFPHLKSRLLTLWTRNRFISSTGGITLEVVKRYIEEQKGK